MLYVWPLLSDSLFIYLSIYFRFFFFFQGIALIAIPIFNFPRAHNPSVCHLVNSFFTFGLIWSDWIFGFRHKSYFIVGHKTYLFAIESRVRLYECTWKYSTVKQLEFYYSPKHRDICMLISWCLRCYFFANKFMSKLCSVFSTQNLRLDELRRRMARQRERKWFECRQ